MMTPEFRRPAGAQQQAADLPVVVIEQPRGSRAARRQGAYQPPLIGAQPVRGLAARENEDVADARLAVQQIPGPAGSGQNVHGLTEARMQVPDGHGEHHHVAQGTEAHH